MPNTLRSITLCLTALAAASLAQAQTADPVVLSFATVGDSRQDPVTPDPTQLAANGALTGQDAHWLQNSKAWSRTLREIGARKPNLLFFNGDMIMGYGNTNLPGSLSDVPTLVATDVVKEHVQYAFWRGMVAPLIEAGTYVVPVPGNHETQCKSSSTTLCTDSAGNNLAAVNGGKNALKVNEDAWRANMADLIFDVPRLNATLPASLTLSNPDTADHSSADGLTTSQSQLSYSFDVGTSHFVVVNTDPVGGDSSAPSVWLAADLAAATGRGAQHFFVFGHKPAYTYDYSGNAGKAGGLDVLPVKRNAFWSVVEQYGATYFCGHEHTFNMRQPVRSDGSQSTAWQVLVGSGGSPFDVKLGTANQQPYDRYYSYAQVRVFQSGKVEIDAYGYSDAYGPTKLLQTAVLAH